MLQKQSRVCKEITAQASFRTLLNQLSLLLGYKAIKCFRAGVGFREFHPKMPLGLLGGASIGGPAAQPLPGLCQELLPLPTQ